LLAETIPAVASAAATARRRDNAPVPSATPYALTATRPRARLVSLLGRRFRPVGLDGVLGDLDRSGEPCTVPGEAAGPGFTWDARDRDDESWWPQGVAAVASRDALIVSWYSKSGRFGTPGSRITVVDRRHRDGIRYRHVLLVAPRRPLGVLTVGAVPVHAGGIAVRDDLLYVADTLFGVRLFRLGDVMRVRRRGLTGRFGARGHDYVLPQLAALRAPLRVPLRSGQRRLRFSFLSIGELDGRPNLVVGEYRRAGRAADHAPRLARYPLDPGTGLPAVGSRGRTAAPEVYENQPNRMQGAVVHGSTWFLTASAGKGVAGDLYVGAPGAWVRHRGVLPTGPEDLDWSRPGEELWCVTEWPGHRWVFPIRTSGWERPPDAGDAGA
jgi:hypothetical protein